MGIFSKFTTSKINQFNNKLNSNFIDPTILNWEDVIIRRSDINTLNPDEWLNDVIISFFYTYLEKDVNNLNFDKILLLRPAIVHLITHSQDPQYLAQALPPNLHQKTYIFIPVNDNTQINQAGGNHWSILIYSKLDKSFFYYDSLRDSNYKYAKLTAHKFSQLLHLTECKLRCMTSPQQPNSNDCGVFVISVTEVLINRMSTHPNYYLHPAEWNINYNELYPPYTQRERIKNLILKLKFKQSQNQK